MPTSYYIRNAAVVNEGRIMKANIAVSNGLIESIIPCGEADDTRFAGYTIIEADGLHLLPGIIDDQVHFREPGLTHKGSIYTESRAAVAGGITSFMEMPNTIPNTLTLELLEEKYAIGAKSSLANYSFYMGASNDNLDEVIRTDPRMVCGIKVFMGSSTGNMLVDKPETLKGIFSLAPCLVAVHCEHEPTVHANFIRFRKQYTDDAPASIHPQIRSAEACYRSSSEAVALAVKHNTRLHILHLSTAMEMDLFSNAIPLDKKRITAEVCLHHLWFSDADYQHKGNMIKWNPAIKSNADREALMESLLSGKIDVVATDHAPHTLDEKTRPYFHSPSGGPMVQHLLPAMLSLHRKGKISLEEMVEKMCHNPAICFQVNKRGFIREGYFADLVLVDLNKQWVVDRNNILYKSGWSPLEGITLEATVSHTFVNGNLVYENGTLHDEILGQRLTFDR
ncbi:MAG: dihydroorotase [Bacteroidetes bacterium]|nr:dihydroorotase [Bacteroidota bacterium]